MDLPSLAVILQAALSPNPDERKAAEQSLNQVFQSIRVFGNFPFFFVLISLKSELCFVLVRLCVIQYLRFGTFLENLVSWRLRLRLKIISCLVDFWFVL